MLTLIFSVSMRSVLKKFHDCGAEVHAVVGFKNKDVVILDGKKE